MIEQCDCWAEQVANIEAIKAEDCRIKTAQKNVTDFKVTSNLFQRNLIRKGQQLFISIYLANKNTLYFALN